MQEQDIAEQDTVPLFERRLESSDSDSFALQQLVQRGDVSLRHLQCFELAEFPIVSQTGHHVAQSVESIV